ncbi:hypothetical protein [Engelhardtia mirabilis]|uniref:Uncharacterized protein n=1 Tax=Engelhardtia mirabilis TaxID=2528011 RepID=A0A518BL38_9BACT|nr:hypothetical protein Pla133_27770 [Planctomycetes bacterium Pla133]QDV02015.1 hypothetical protein Pla86_27760 [Planctomycetes bacterium Pla86]
MTTLTTIPSLTAGKTYTAATELSEITHGYTAEFDITTWNEKVPAMLALRRPNAEGVYMGPLADHDGEFACIDHGDDDWAIYRPEDLRG